MRHRRACLRQSLNAKETQGFQRGKMSRAAFPLERPVDPEGNGQGSLSSRSTQPFPFGMWLDHQMIYKSQTPPPLDETANYGQAVKVTASWTNRDPDRRPFRCRLLSDIASRLK